MTTTLDPAGIAALADFVRREIDEGRSAAAQFALGIDGKVAEYQWFGAATEGSTMLMFSATKPFVAMCLLEHLASGALDLMAPVADYVPGFGANGKADTTVLQVLTMQGGFPQNVLGPDQWGSSEGRLAAFADWVPAWPAGSRTEYHPVNAHWVIAELITQLSARSYVDVVNELTRAAGGKALLGPAATADVRPIEVQTAGEPPTDDAALVALFGRPELVPDSSVTPEALLGLNIEFVQHAAIPGGGGIARACDLAQVYQSWLHNPDGLLHDGWRRDALGTVRNASINTTSKVPANRTIAGEVAGLDAYAAHRWMPSDMPRTFGHAGAGGQLAWVDPESGVSFCFLHDRLHLDPAVDFVRCRDLNRLAADCIRTDSA